MVDDRLKHVWSDDEVDSEGITEDLETRSARVNVEAQGRAWRGCLGRLEIVVAGGRR
jgi:hypothetical protein